MKQASKTLLVTVIVIAAFLLFARFRGDTVSNIAFGDDALTLTAPQKYTCVVDYDDIQSLELTDSFDPGTQVSGGENRRYIWGERETALWERCTFCVSKKIDNAIVITTTDGGHILFNYESEDTTAAILPMFRTLLDNRNAA